MNYIHKYIVLLLILLGFNCNATAQQNPDLLIKQPVLNAKGVKAPAANFTGTVWVNMLVTAQDQLNSSIGSVTFEPGARTNWHSHPGGQVLLVTEGKGLYQEKGGPVRVIKKNEVIKCRPNIEHWHGATPKKKLTHVAIAPNSEKGPAVWSGPVTDEEYKGKL